jgi:hypothetical protein
MQAYNYWQDQPGNYFVGKEKLRGALTDPTVEVLSTLFRRTAPKSVFKYSYKRRKSLSNGQRPSTRFSCVISLVLFYVFTRAHHDTKRSDAIKRHRLSQGRLFDASYDPTNQAQPTLEEGSDLRSRTCECLNRYVCPIG